MELKGVFRAKVKNSKDEPPAHTDYVGACVFCLQLTFL